jgi:hypothetical protein
MLSLLGSKSNKKNASADSNRTVPKAPTDESKRKKKSRMSEFPMRSEPEYTTKARPASSAALSSDRKPKRFSLGGRLSRRISNYTIGDIRNSGEAAPPCVPAIPTHFQQPSQGHPATAKLPASRRTHSNPKNLVLASHGSSPGASQRQQQQRHSRLWQSSNPEGPHQHGQQRSPVSSRDTTSERLLGNNASRSTLSVSRNNSSNTTTSDSLVTTTTHDSRSTSCYIPRSAAKGFLNSTSGASEEAQREWRRSAMLLASGSGGIIGGGSSSGSNGSSGNRSPDEDRVRLTDDHTREWEHLKARMPAFEARPVVLLDVDEVDRRLGRFGERFDAEEEEVEYREIQAARMQALAALEQRI